MGVADLNENGNLFKCLIFTFLRLCGRLPKQQMDKWTDGLTYVSRMVPISIIYRPHKICETSFFRVLEMLRRKNEILILYIIE